MDIPEILSNFVPNLKIDQMLNKVTTEMSSALSALRRHGIRPSLQRALVLDYLLSHRCHNTADEIYRGLCVEMPALSRATVFNTLRLFVDSGLAQALSFEGDPLRYDSETRPHAHLRCPRCGAINDCALSDELTERIKSELPGSEAGFQLTVPVICCRCGQKEKEINNR